MKKHIWTSDAAALRHVGHRGRRGAATTSHNLGFPAGGIRRPHPRLVIWGRGCGNPWSLSDIPSPQTPLGGIGLLRLKT